MARSLAEEKRLARKYGRRQRLLRASRSAHEFDAAAQRLLADLRALRVPAARITELRRGLEVTDVKRHHAAVWAILDALEAAEEAASPQPGKGAKASSRA
ncbi:MAG: hypothetical protein U0271_16225 [Polyangiaceae bacterium]